MQLRDQVPGDRLQEPLTPRPIRFSPQCDPCEAVPTSVGFSPVFPRVVKVSHSAAGRGVQASDAILGQCIQVSEIQAGEVQLSQQACGQPRVPKVKACRSATSSAMLQVSGATSRAVLQVSGATLGAMPQVSGATSGAMPQVSGATVGAMPQGIGATSSATLQIPGVTSSFSFHGGQREPTGHGSAVQVNGTGSDKAGTMCVMPGSPGAHEDQAGSACSVSGPKGAHKGQVGSTCSVPGSPCTHADQVGSMGLMPSSTGAYKDRTNLAGSALAPTGANVGLDANWYQVGCKGVSQVFTGVTKSSGMQKSWQGTASLRGRVMHSEAKAQVYCERIRAGRVPVN